MSLKLFIALSEALEISLEALLSNSEDHLT
jgi:hypothetical protein